MAHWLTGLLNGANKESDFRPNIIDHPRPFALVAEDRRSVEKLAQWSNLKCCVRWPVVYLHSS